MGKIKEYDYRMVCGAPSVTGASLSPRQDKINRRSKLPPIERLRELFGYDTEYGGLFWQKNKEYISIQQFALCIDSKHYALWRIVSMLLLGTSTGWHPEAYAEPTPPLSLPVGKEQPPKEKKEAVLNKKQREALFEQMATIGRIERNEKTERLRQQALRSRSSTDTQSDGTKKCLDLHTRISFRRTRSRSRLNGGRSLSSNSGR